MMLSRPAAHVYSDGEKRHFRFMSMIHEEGKQVLKVVLEKQLAGSTLAERLAEPEVKTHIEDALHRKVIQRNQFDILYPISGAIAEEIIDVTLFAFLIRQLHPSFKVGNKVWLNPSHSDISAEADVTRLKLKRNKSAHSGINSLTTDEFEVEFQELNMVLCRLVRYANCAELTLTDIVRNLANKKEGLFENKPESLHMATNTSSSLENVSAGISVSDSDSIYTVSSIGNAECIRPDQKEATTSTSSLEKKRKLSFKVKSVIEPFIMSPKKENEKENTPLPKRTKTKGTLKLSERNCKTCSCSVRRLCRNTEASSITTNDHSTQPYRCNISGISVLDTGIIIVADSSHDIVQALSSSGDIIDEFECSKPQSVVALGSNKVAVTLRTSCRVIVLKMNEARGCLELEHEYVVGCEFWLSDIKYSSGYLYVLCDNGDLHILDSKTMSDSGRIPTGLQFASHFDINEKGDRIFISHGQHISCLDGFGNKRWCHSDKTKKTFKSISVQKNTLFVCAWEDDTVLVLTNKRGNCLKVYRDEQMRKPWSLCVHKKKLYVSQYMSGLNSSSCREIMVMKM